MPNFTTIKLVFLFLSFLFANQTFADWSQEERKIAYLLSEIKRLDAVFVRNDSDHSPEEAVSHLRMKLKSAQNSWFAPAKEKWTAELFIEKIASKSSISGEPYLIKFKNGRTVAAGEWLKDRLNDWNLSKD